MSHLWHEVLCLERSGAAKPQRTKPWSRHQLAPYTRWVRSSRRRCKFYCSFQWQIIMNGQPPDRQESPTLHSNLSLSPGDATNSMYRAPNLQKIWQYDIKLQKLFMGAEMNRKTKQQHQLIPENPFLTRNGSEEPPIPRKIRQNW